MKYQELKLHLNQALNGERNFAPAYFVYGNDDYLLGEAVKLFKSVVDGDFVALNFTESSDMGETLQTLSTFPVFDAHRVCRYVFDEETTEDDVEALKGYLSSPVPESILVVSCSAREAAALATNSCEAVVCDSLKDDELSREVKALMSPTPIDDAAVAELVTRTQSSMARIVSETKKLKAYSPDGIKKKDVEDMVASDLEYQTYKLAEAVSLKDGKGALIMLQSILDSGVHPRVALASLYERYRRMLHISLNSGLSNDELAKLFGLKKSGAVYYLRKGAENYSQTRLKSAVDYLHFLQTESVSGRNDLNLLQEAVLQLLNDR